MLVLGKDQRVRERAEACTHVAEENASLVLAGHPQIRGGELPSTPDGCGGEADLAVQLERACLHGNRARRRLRLRLLVHDPHAHAPPRQPQGQHQAGRPRANDENIRVANWLMTSAGFVFLQHGEKRAWSEDRQPRAS